MPTRRSFLVGGTGVAALAALRGSVLQAAVATMQKSDTAAVTRLSDGWEYLQGTMGGAWEVWHSEETAVWSKVAMPHSFNAYDACDPDTPYYMGNGWYRTHVVVANPYADGRTLLHFEGAGQTAKVYVGSHLVGEHRGGYDEFVVDITDAVAELAKAPVAAKEKAKEVAGVPIAVLCDNSRDLDRIPSDLSDFSLYGGMYRHVNLVYVPAVSLSRVHVKTEIATPDAEAKVTVLGTTYAPGGAAGKVKFSVAVQDTAGKVVHRATGLVGVQEAEQELVRLLDPA